MTDAFSQLHVVRRDDHGRYELYGGEELLSFAEFSESDGVVRMPYVETLVQHRGNDYSSHLMAGVVDDLRSRGLRIQPTCPVAHRYVRALPDADQLLVR